MIVRQLRALASNALLGPGRWLLTISIGAYAAIFFLPRPSSAIRMCGGDGVTLMQFIDRFGVMPPSWSVQTISQDWVMMSIAMMSPLIAPQISYVWRSVAPSTRAISVFLVYFSYLTAWGLVGIFLVPIAINAVAMFGLLPSFFLWFALALLWAAAPLAQLFRNRCHVFPRIAGFGWRAARDAAWIGYRVGIYCVLVCWPWMLIPTFIDQSHLTGMILIGGILLADRIAPACCPRWRMPPAFRTFLGGTNGVSRFRLIESEDRSNSVFTEESRTTYQTMIGREELKQ